MKVHISPYLKLLLAFFGAFSLYFTPQSVAQCIPEGYGDPNGDELGITAVNFFGVENHFQFEACGKPDLADIDKFAGYRYFWDFGDGTYSFGDKPYHEYLTTGTFYPKVHLVKAYTSSKNGLGVLRTAAPAGSMGSGQVAITVSSVESGASYDDNDGYSAPFLDPTQNVEIEPAFDLVPAYLETFVLTLKNNCGAPGVRQVILTYPHNMFSQDSGALFPNPENPAETTAPHIPPNNAPESSEAVYPIEGGLVFSASSSASEPDTIRFNIVFSASADELVHVFLNLYASPFLPVGENINISALLADCSNSTASVSRGSGNFLEKSVPVRSSHDPNYKYVDDHQPAEDKLIYISGNQPTRLTFRLAFQNEGDLLERSITVLDTLAEELDFNTFKLLNVVLADTNVAQSICDYPPIWRDYVWESLDDPTHYYKMTKDPAKRVVSWELKTSLLGAQMVNPQTGDTIPEAWSWGYIDFEIFTRCNLPDQHEFSNLAGIVFKGQDTLLTNEVHIRRICYNNRDFVYTGPGFDLDLVNIARRFYPNGVFDYRTAVITGTRSGQRFPVRHDTIRGSEYRYTTDTTLYSLWDTVSFTNRRTKDLVLVDNLRYTICDTAINNCYPISVFLMINPDGKDALPAYNCDDDCTPAPPVKDPYPRWWYWLIGIILVLLMLISALRKRRRNARRRRR